MLDERYEFREETPAADEYRSLRVLAGLSPKSAKGASLGLPNTLFAVTVRCDGRLIGMGRIVGDGGLAFLIVDVAVDPAHQRQGLGKAIVGALVDHLRRTAPEGAHISLIADGPAKDLYAQFGFRPTAPAAIGMDLLFD
jgi:GNAT superfamily N-acetyltransferase